MGEGWKSSATHAKNMDVKGDSGEISERKDEEKASVILENK